MDELKNKYLLISLICSIILIGSSFIPLNSESDEIIIGFVSEITETNNGYVMNFIEVDGNNIHCFSKTKFELYQIYEISGSYSNDNSIFFISSFVLCQTE